MTRWSKTNCGRSMTIRSQDYGDAAGQDSPAIEANVADRLLTRGHLSLASSFDQFDHLL
jgi:hypothetical protein